MGKIRAGVIGCGAIANDKHLAAVKKTGLADVVGFCDTVPANAQKSLEMYGAEGAKAYTDYKEMLKDDSIDVVYVCTSNRSHSFISVDALRAGKHVMCEKPMAINTEEARKMVDAAKETGKLLTIGYQSRFMPDYRYVKKFAQSGGFGDMYFARAKALRRRGVPTWGVFIDQEQQGGGPLIDIGTHALDLTLWTMDNYKPKYAVGTVYHKLNDTPDQGNSLGEWNPKNFTVEDSAFGFIVMENGATIILESSWALNERDPQEASFTLSGTKAGVDFRDGLHINSVQNGSQVITKVDVGNGGGVAWNPGPLEEPPEVLEQRTFLNAAMGKGELVVTPEQAFTVTQILEGIYKSAETGKPVYFD